ncbi:hypothetical protein [Desmospora activa]|uniref:Uncharacterized protein n=1 Tax=Desmospora activa DSM 45169 TaxID=1121389 RepID=A0A2T4Z9L7_9BACL|nr:hypothetical protein [Desmospora activa]PTM58584.1 hypothetical protein C8J48_1169 [Desmospora activa DSM 45169]
MKREEEKPLVLRLVGSGRDAHQRLRLRHAYGVTFIRGARDRSPWREEGRRHQLLIGGMQREQRSWLDRSEQRRLPPRSADKGGS